MISVDFSALIITALVFTLVLVLGRFFFQPLAGAMEKRQGKIDAAENIRAETMKEVEAIIATHRGAMSGVRDEDYEALEETAYLLRSPDMKGKAWEDLQNVMERLGLTPPAKTTR